MKDKITKFLLFLVFVTSVNMVKGQYTQVPDQNFEKVLFLYDDIPNDGKVPTDNISTVEILNVSGNGIISLEGIEGFRELKSLDCSKNNLSFLDVSRNEKLETLNCNDNNIEEISINKNKSLEYLFCSGNKLTELDLIENVNLKYLYCFENNLESIEVGTCLELKHLYCYSNFLTQIDISRNVKLTRFFAYSNLLSYLNVGLSSSSEIRIFKFNDNPDLKFVYVNGQSAKSNEVMKNTEWYADKGVSYSNSGMLYIKIPDESFERALIEIGVDKSGALDGRLLVTDLITVTKLDISNKGIKTLTGIEYFVSLEELNCSGNKLKKIDISQNKEMRILNCSNNQIDNLFISKNKFLENLNCSSNELAVLDVTKNVHIKSLNCHGNKLSDLLLTSNLELEILNCSNNKLQKLDVSENVNIKEVSCSENSTNFELIVKNIKIKL